MSVLDHNYFKNLMLQGFEEASSLPIKLDTVPTTPQRKRNIRDLTSDNSYEKENARKRQSATEKPVAKTKPPPLITRLKANVKTKRSPPHHPPSTPPPQGAPLGQPLDGLTHFGPEEALSYLNMGREGWVSTDLIDLTDNSCSPHLFHIIMKSIFPKYPLLENKLAAFSPGQCWEINTAAKIMADFMIYPQTLHWSSIGGERKSIWPIKELHARLVGELDGLWEPEDRPYHSGVLRDAHRERVANPELAYYDGATMDDGCWQLARLLDDAVAVVINVNLCHMRLATRWIYEPSEGD